MAHQTIDRPIAVLVEGSDYYHFLLHSYKEAQVLRDVWLYDFGGVDSLTAYLRAFRATPGFGGLKAVGIIRDAETNAASAKAAIESALNNNQLPVPPGPNQISVGVPRIGYLLIPHEQPAGCLEDACLAACRHPRELQCATAFLQCIGEDPANPNWNAKVKSRAVVAAVSPGKTLGQSAATQLWDRNAPSLNIIEQFIASLY